MTDEYRPAEQCDFFAEDLYQLVTPPANEDPAVDLPIPYAPTGLRPPPAARLKPCSSSMPYVARRTR